MAERPFFVPRSDGSRLVQEINVKFSWHPGFAPIQKKKNVCELHSAASKKGFSRLLEVSTKSDEVLGQRLSAFNLKVELSAGLTAFLESVYQGSKVFKDGGPFTDLYDALPRDAKRDDRLRNSGPLIGFNFLGTNWELEPKTAFYDWLYLYSLKDHADFLRRLFEYDGFSDIEFNPGKSLNCQARSCAMLVSLLKKNLFPTVAYDKELFLSVLRPDAFAQPHSSDIRQGTLI
jgi:hypothetical protein